MTDPELILFLSGAFLPFAKGFADDPQVVTLVVQCTPAQVTGTLTVSQTDFDLLHSGSQVEVDIGRAFRSLVAWKDPKSRTPSLVIRV